MTPKSNWMRQADTAFAIYIKQRDGACLNCGSTRYLQCAHIHSRSYKTIRVNPDNAVALCRSCHMKYTNRPLEWADWVEARWPGRWSSLKELALTYERVDWKTEAVYWRNQ